MATPFSDPAIIDSSIISMSGPSSAGISAEGPQEGGSLEPGSALSKLLDSAMANAAKELTPEFDGRTSEAASPRKTSFLEFVPAKVDTSRVYSIEKLLSLRATPGVAQFDVSLLPVADFWCFKPGKVRQQEGQARNATKPKSNRRGQNQNLAAPSWERKPAGFAKSAELDTLSADKISQLLGEGPDEDVPEWDTPNDSGMDMGQTVEDFEKWKQHMRQKEKKDYEDEPHPDGDTPRGNDVDSFFSFVKPKEAAEKTGVSPNPSTDAKSSRFSSFFGGPGPEEPKRPPPGLSQKSAEGLRFFGMNEAPPMRGPGPVSHPQQQMPQQQKQMPRQVQPGQPGLGPATTQQQRPASGQMGQPSHPFQFQGAPPPGLPQGTNDSFFLSLLNKREDEPRDGAREQPRRQQSQQSSQAQQLQQLQQAQHARAQLQAQQQRAQQEQQIPQQHQQQGRGQNQMPPWMAGKPGAQPQAPQASQYYQYQVPPPGMYAPGMVPPGMQPPGIHMNRLAESQQGAGRPMQGHPAQQGNQQHPGQGVQGSGQQGQGIPGQYPPPGYYGFPPGMPPGMVPQQHLPPHLRPSQQ